MSISCAILSFVPTPSVAAINMGSSYPEAFKSKRPPKPPKSPTTPLRFVVLANGLIVLINVFPISISTPASLYEIPDFITLGEILIIPPC